MGDHRLRLRIEEHGVVPDGLDAGQVVGDHDDRGTEGVAEIQDEVVE
jgi:hypothetical protein